MPYWYFWVSAFSTAVLPVVSIVAAVLIARGKSLKAEGKAVERRIRKLEKRSNRAKPTLRSVNQLAGEMRTLREQLGMLRGAELVTYSQDAYRRAGESSAPPVAGR